MNPVNPVKGDNVLAVVHHTVNDLYEVDSILVGQFTSLFEGVLKLGPLPGADCVAQVERYVFGGSAALAGNPDAVSAVTRPAEEVPAALIDRSGVVYWLPAAVDDVRCCREHVSVTVPDLNVHLYLIPDDALEGWVQRIQAAKSR